jgi:L-amino acid N-acyltransferase YncA
MRRKMTGPYRPRTVTLRDGREVTLRAIVEADAAEIVQAFERLSAQSRYYRFMTPKKRLNAAAVQRGVHPRPGRDFAFVATVPSQDAIDIVGAAQYVPARERSRKACEFAITVAEDWRHDELATRLLASLVRRARRDGYATMEGWVLAENTAMLTLARKLKFKVETVPGDSTLLRVQRALQA